MAKFNLVIFHTPRRQSLSDFTTVREILGSMAPYIDVHIVSPELPAEKDFWVKAVSRPTVMFSPMPEPPDLGPSIRGLRLFAKPVSKFDEARMLAAAGFPVPLTQKILPGTVLDERIWGPFTVIKPNKSYLGRGISLVRSRDVRWIDTKLLPPTDPRFGQNLIAQQFVDTGPHVACYRVFTVLGEPVYSVMSKAVQPVPPLSVLASRPVEIAVAANGMERRMSLFDDPDILALARQIHRKLGHTSVMGIDIIRDHVTGKPVVLEMNSGGWTWHLSSDHGIHQQHDQHLDYYAQYNALEVIADALVNVTRSRAK
jgi:hypothetical protein